MTDSAAVRLAFGRNLRVERARTGMKQLEVSLATGIPVPTLSHWERGQHEPGLTAVLTLCRFYGRTVEEMTS